MRKVWVEITDTPQEQIDEAARDGIVLSGRTFTFSVDPAHRDLLAGQLFREWHERNSAHILATDYEEDCAGVIDGWEWELVIRPPLEWPPVCATPQRLAT